MALHYDNNEDSLRAQRMTAAEARAVIDLWQQEREEQRGLTDHPAVPDVAEGLGIPVADVQRLLVEVRVRRVEETRRALEQELAELQRQWMELRREQANWRELTAPRRQWGGAEHKTPPGFMSFFLPQVDLVEFLRGFLPGFVAIAVALAFVFLLTALSRHTFLMP